MTSRLRHPLLAPWYRLVADGERLLLEHGRSVVCFEGAAVQTLLPALLPLLDGTRTADELLAALGASARPAVEQALKLLEDNGVVVEGPRAALPAANMLAAALGAAPAAVEQRLRSATVAVAGRAGAAEQVAALLASSGVGTIERPAWGADPSGVELAVVVPAPDEAPRLEAWNARALEEGLPWLPLRPFDGLICGIGPLVVPHESACFECLLLRMAGHLEYGSDVRAVERAPVAASSTAALDAIAAAVATHIALGWIGGPDTTLPGLLYVLETRPSLALASHAVLRVPRCPACSTSARSAPSLPWHAAELKDGHPA